MHVCMVALTLQTDVTELLEFLGLKSNTAPSIPEKADDNAADGMYMYVCATKLYMNKCLYVCSHVSIDPTSASFLLKPPQPGAGDSAGLKKSRTAALRTARADGKSVSSALTYIESQYLLRCRHPCNTKHTHAIYTSQSMYTKA